MDWSNSNLQKIIYNAITPTTYTPKQKKVMASFCNKQHNTTCIYCGGAYRNIKGCIFDMDTGTNFRPVCQLCYIVTHYVPSYSKMLLVCKSNMSQLDIIRTTVNYITVNKKAPSVNDIDVHAVPEKMKPTQFFKSHDTSMRLFYTSNIDMTNIILGIVDVSTDFAGYAIEDGKRHSTKITNVDIIQQRKTETIKRLSILYAKINEQQQFYSKLDKLEYEKTLNL